MKLLRFKYLFVFFFPLKVYYLILRQRECVHGGRGKERENPRQAMHSLLRAGFQTPTKP